MLWKQAETYVISNGPKTLFALIDSEPHNCNWFIFRPDERWNLTLLYKGSASNPSSAKAFAEDWILKFFQK